MLENFLPRRIIKPSRSKKINVNPALDKNTHDKLYKLAISCNMTKTKMAEKIILQAVNHPDIIEHFQNTYNTEPNYRIVPIVTKETVIY